MLEIMPTALRAYEARLGLFSIIDNAEHDLAAMVAVEAALERAAGIRKGENFVHRRPQIAVVDEVRNPNELLPVGRDDEVDGANPTFGRALLRGLGGYSDEPAAPPHDGRRPLERIAADGVEHELDFFDDVLEAGHLMIDHLVGAEPPHRLDIFGRCRSDNVSATPVCKLNGEAADNASRAMDQHSLTCFQVAVVEERLPSGEGRERNRGALDVTERSRLRDEDALRNDGVVSGGSVVIETAQPVYRFSDREVVNI